MAIRLLQSALPRPQLTEADALDIMAYHLERNERAEASHRKTWLKQHKDVNFKLLL